MPLRKCFTCCCVDYPFLDINEVFVVTLPQSVLMKKANCILKFLYAFRVFIKKLLICGSTRSPRLLGLPTEGAACKCKRIELNMRKEANIINYSHTFCQLGTSSSGLAQNGGATSADHNALGVTEHGCDSVATGALNIHEVGVRMLHQTLQFVLAFLLCGQGVQ